MPGEPAVVALRCLMAAAWPGWSLLQPLEKERSTICRWPSEPIPGVDGWSGTSVLDAHLMALIFHISGHVNIVELIVESVGFCVFNASFDF